MNTINKKGIPLLQFSSFAKEKLFHFTTTISGGVSDANYATFNLGMYSGDNIENIAENRAQLSTALDIEEEDMYVPYQIHKDKICVIDKAFLSNSDLEKARLLHGVDALITDIRGICIGITTADCVPVLIYDPVKNVFAAVHAGWRGTLKSITATTASKMIQQWGCNPRDIRVGIAPSISAAYFEVGDEVYESFYLAGFDMDRISFRKQNTGKFHIDLKEANRLQLIQAGIVSAHIEVTDYCTYRDKDIFFSARRQGVDSGRMITGGILR